MQDWKMTDLIAGLENVGLENAGSKNETMEFKDLKK